MKTSTKPNPLSSFGQAALALDTDFFELENISAQIEHLQIESDAGLARAQTLLKKFGECGNRITNGIQVLSKELSEMRKRAEDSAQLISDKATHVQKRQLEMDQIVQRFQALKELVHKGIETAAQFKSFKGKDISTEEKSILLKQLSEFDTQLEILVTQLQNLKQDASQSNMKNLSREIDSVRQSLDSSRKKLKAAATPLLSSPLSP